MDGEAVPERAPLETHRANKAYKGGGWAGVAVDISKLSSKAERVNITMPARVLTIVDEAAAREVDTRSGLLARAALSYVERHAIHN